MSAFSEATTRYGAVAAGLVLGTAAKYGLSIGDGKPVTMRSVVADLLLLGMLMVIAITVTDYMQLTGNSKVLAGALTAVSSDRLIRQLRRRFEQRILSELDAQAGTGATTTASAAQQQIAP